jgi:hypothetical protein
MPMRILCSRMFLRRGRAPHRWNSGGMTHWDIIVSPEARKLLLSFVGSGMLLRRTYDVWRTNGEDDTLVDRAIDESLLSVLLVLASFL